jgi:hypothetical protein
MHAQPIDFSGDAFVVLAHSMVGPNRTREQAVKGLKRRGRLKTSEEESYGTLNS